MPKAIYRKCEATEVITYQEGNWMGIGKIPDEAWKIVGTDDFTFTSENGYQLSGKSKTLQRGYMGSTYVMDGLTLVHYKLWYPYQSSAYTHYEYRVTPTKIVSHKRGAYLTDVILDFGSVPENGRAEDGYWYEFVRLVGMYCGIAGTSREVTGWVQSEGIWKEQNEILANAGGIWKS